MNDSSGAHRSGTVFTDVKTVGSALELRADYFPSALDLKTLGAHFPPAQVLSADPLVVKFDDGAHMVAFGFGAVVFWQVDWTAYNKVLEDVRRVLTVDPPDAAVGDSLSVLVGQDEERVTFREVWLKQLTVEHIKLISGTFGQSVALKHCELSVTRALNATAPMVRALEQHGEMTIPQKNILKTVGFTLAVREAVLARFSLFDDPAETWQSERLSELYARLYEHFDVRKRVAAMQEKVTFLSDLNLMLMSLLQNRTSHRLEWIVILLIVIEVLFSIAHFVTGR